MGYKIGRTYLKSYGYVVYGGKIGEWYTTYIGETAHYYESQPALFHVPVSAPGYFSGYYKAKEDMEFIKKNDIVWVESVNTETNMGLVNGVIKSSQNSHMLIVREGYHLSEFEKVTDKETLQSLFPKPKYKPEDTIYGKYNSIVGTKHVLYTIDNCVYKDSYKDILYVGNSPYGLLEKEICGIVKREIKNRFLFNALLNKQISIFDVDKIPDSPFSSGLKEIKSAIKLVGES